MSGNNRRGEDERRILDEQLDEALDVVQDRVERRSQRAEAERRAAEYRQAGAARRRERLYRLYQETTQTAPPEARPFLEKFLLGDEPPAAEEWPPAGAIDLERLGFLKALAEDDEAVTTRLVYADWLDDRGEHEEADRQRRWPAARERLVRMAEQLAQLEDEAAVGDAPPPYRAMCFERLVEFGRGVARGWAGYDDAERDWVEPTAHDPEFWAAWSVVTGLPAPQGLERMGFHQSYCCPTDISDYYGLPEEEPVEPDYEPPPEDVPTE